MPRVLDATTPSHLNLYDIDMDESRSLFKNMVSEFFGTFTFVYISLAGVNQAVLSGSSSQLEVAICFALGLSAGILVSSKSGAHLNPAVSFTVFLTTNDFTFKKMLGYILAQVLGGFFSGLLVIAVYYSWINNLPESNVLIGSFGTLKNENLSLFGAILDQFVGSALLMFGITLTPESWSKPITVGTVLGGLALFQGTNGFAFNLARDFGPRMASSIVFGSDSFTAMDYWFWVPMVVPFIGVPFGWTMAHLLKHTN